MEDEKRKKAVSTSSTLHELSHQELDVSFLSSDESLPETSNIVATDTSRKRKDIVSPKLVATLDRCQLSIRDCLYYSGNKLLTALISRYLKSSEMIGATLIRLTYKYT